ncbi:MAG: T9SS type A sorting domain-containing protein, partial [Ignavibacteria bacterium]|nr:T9SS type A sorting domain-containing protein [Ignavibacteria bacterium]
DKEYITTDLTPGSIYKNNLYMSWTRFSNNTGIKLTKSTNGVVNWTAAVNISTDATAGQGSDLAVGLSGEIYVTWVGGTASEDYIYFSKSVNGGTSFDSVKTISIGATPNIPISSSGVTFPSIATDISGGPGNGNIYISYCDARTGDPDIYLLRSTNRGANWSTPLRVNDDAVANGKLQCWPWIEVNDSGNIAIVYYDSRNTTSNTIIEAYLGYSINGGVSFTNHKLSSEPSPTVAPNSAVRFGDYIGIDYFKDRIIPIWCDERLGGTNQEAFTSIVSTPVSISSLTNNIPDKFFLEQNYPNPFNPTTNLEFRISYLGFVSLKVYDVLGNEVATLVNERKNAGSYKVEFDGSGFSSGTYFYRIQATNVATGESIVETKKMLLIK